MISAWGFIQNCLQVPALEEKIVALQERNKHQHRRVSVCVTKELLATEITRIRPDLALAVCMLFDEPDKFFEERGPLSNNNDWTLDQWIEYLVMAYPEAANAYP